MLTGVKAVTRVWIVAAAPLLGACQPTVPPLPPSPAAGPAPGTVASAGTGRRRPPPRPAGGAGGVAGDEPAPRGRSIAATVAGSVDVLALPENIESLCRRHPEMGPCQYERDACRQRGGRVLTSRGEEVTPGVEAEPTTGACSAFVFEADGGGEAAEPARAAAACQGWRAAKVLQLRRSPVSRPTLNQRWRCSAEPWVNESGTT